MAKINGRLSDDFQKKLLKIIVFDFSFQKQYKDNDMVFLASFVVCLTFTILFCFACCLCRRKSKERAKKRHFEKLVSDLNATEKFTLVSPSDEEVSD